jgi:hypothetical protein
MKLWSEIGFHAIGISEVFEVEYPQGILEEVDARRQEILSSLLAQLCNSACAGWLGRQDADVSTYGMSH